jgi:hypothetical protein
MTRLQATVLAGVVLSAAACGEETLVADALFVTMQDATGGATVFGLGSHSSRLAAGCGERLDALIEPGCPRLSMAFYVRGPDLANPLELYVQGAYGFVMRSDGALHHRTVSDIAIEGRDGQIVTGHYRLALDEAPGPATDVWGRFALCAETGSTIEPCRNM